ncbi:MMPL family transporter [Actinomadura sp. NTSP31]|uniref:MMPL family transporter n=1 Tax=Actinomadura sp. NTSP31 TaxID=1735447 RepID=UPI0035C16DDE
MPLSGWRRCIPWIVGRRSKWAVLAVWVLLIAVGGSLAAKVGSVQDNDPASWLPADAQSTRAVEIGQRYFADRDTATATVVYTRGGTLTAADLAKAGHDRAALGPAGAGPASGLVVSPDRGAAYFGVPLRTAKNDNGVLGDEVKHLRSLVRTDAPAGLTIKITGEAGSIADYIDVYSGMDGLLLGVTLAIVAVLLLLTYRSPLLWLVPLLVVAMGSQVASGAVYLAGRYAGLPVDGLSIYILTVLSLGVGTDYALLLIARYREELHWHADRHAAMAQALRRCLPAIGASAATVGLATLCLVLGRMNSTRGLGPVVAVGVVVVFAAMSTLLPALLVTLGRWVFWPFVPRHLPGAVTEPDEGRGVWAGVARFVARSPRLVWIATAGVLVVLALGSATLSNGLTQAEQFTTKTDSVTGQRLLADHFPAGASAPVDVYVPAERAPGALAALARTPGVASATATATARGRTHLAAVLRAAPETPAARRAVQRIRTDLRGDGAVVGGPTAVALDTADAQAGEDALLFPLILAVVGIMLLLLLRAVVAPLVLLGSVVLSYAAALGTAALIFHALGHPRIDQGLLLFGFLFLVALGVDYTIFLMTRVREEVHRVGHTEGVLTGLRVTGGVITSAGIVLAATFSVLAVIPTVNSLQEGVLVAVGVLLDTFLVRSLLVPALAIRIGPAFWWPHSLGRRSVSGPAPAGRGRWRLGASRDG